MGLWGKKDIPVRSLITSGMGVSGPMPPDAIFRSKQEAKDFVTQYKIQEDWLSTTLQSLDFEQEIGIIAFHASATTCGDVDIAAVDDEGGTLVVYVVKRSFNSLCGQLPTIHIHYGAIPKTDKQIRFAAPLMTW